MMHSTKLLSMTLILALMAASHASGQFCDCFQGNDLHGLGAATLAETNGQLVVSNIGSSGDDGVAFQPPLSRNFQLDLVSPFPSGTGTASVTLEYLVLMTYIGLEIDETSIGMAIDAHFPTASQSGVVLEVWRGGQLIASLDGSTGTGVDIIGSSDLQVVMRGGDPLAFELTFPGTRQCILPNGDFELADRIAWRANGTPLAPIDKVRLKGRDLASLAVRAALVGPIDGVFAQARGDTEYGSSPTALLEVQSGNASGDGAVRFISENVLISAEFDLSVGMIPQTTASGVRVAAGDITGDGIELVEITGNGEVTPGSAASPSYGLEVYDAGVLVATYSNLSGRVCTLNGFPSRFKIDFEAGAAAGPGGGPHVRVFDGYSGGLFPGANPSGMPVFIACDEIVLIPEGAAALPGVGAGNDVLLGTTFDIEFFASGSVQIFDLVVEFSPPVAEFPGTADGLLFLSSDENGVLTGGPANDRKELDAGDPLELLIDSMDPIHNAAPLLLVGQVFLGGAAPTSPFPGIAVDPAAAFLLFGAPTAAGPPWLPQSGQALAFVLPSVLVGHHLLLQALVATPLATNGIFSSADGHDIIVR